MKISIPPPNVRAGMIGSVDISFVLVALCGLAGSFAYLLGELKAEEKISAGFFILIGAMAFIAFFSFCCLAVLFARMEVSSEGIKYRYIRSHVIPWSSVVEYRFLGLVPKMGFTSRIMIKTESGKVHFIPIASAVIIGYFNGLQAYKRA